MPIKPCKKEAEYFAKLEFEKKKKIEEEKQKKLKEEEKRKLKELHFMKCPKCGMDLEEIECHTIKADKCFSCNGLWFDTNELEHVIELHKPAITRLFNFFK